MRLLKILLMGITILDVAVFPFSCSSSSRNDNELYLCDISYYQMNEVTGELENQLEKRFHHLIGDDYSDGAIINAEDIDQAVEQIMNRYYEDFGEYEIIKYMMMDSSHELKEIELPYQITEDDQLGYFEGIRGATIIFVEIVPASSTEY